MDATEKSDRHCPKCNARVGDTASNCASCGLAVAHFAAFASEAPVASQALVAAWKVVEENWAKDSAHESFAALVEVSGEYHIAARWYRAAVSIPSQAVMAETMLQRLRTMAVATLLSADQKTKDTRGRNKKILVVVLGLLICLVGIGILLMFKNVAKQRRGENGSAASQTSVHA